MFDRPRRGIAARVSLAGLVLSTLVLPSLPGAAAGSDELMRFAAEMAERGSWREARYRWLAVLDQEPDNVKVINNLAVTHEILGETDEAREQYRRAAALAPGNPEIQENLRRFDHFWRYNWQSESDEQDSNGDDAPLVAVAPPKNQKKSKSKTAEVTVRLPVPPRIEVRGDESLLVTSFRAGENAMLDTNYEMVEFLRGEFRKATSMNVLDIDPPPAIPEQTIEDLLANQEFWQHLGRSYSAQIIVSGVVNYVKRDLSGFQDVDVVSATTGQKIRQNRFVEQEEFRYVVDLFFIDGPSGTLRFRDRLQRAVVFQGKSNDPIAAFFALSDSIAADILAVVTPRVREDTRMIFKR